MRSGPLAGVRVLEFASIGPGPFCAMLLSDMGADVIRIDRPSGVAPTDVAVRDVSGDGIADLIVVEQGSNGLSVSLGLGGGAFQGRVFHPLLLGPESLAIGDVTNDGVLDLVVTDFGSIVGYSLSVLRGVGGGAFAARESLSTGYDPYEVRLADLDADGSLDAVTSCNYSPFVDVHRGGLLTPHVHRSLFGSGGHPAGLAIADFDGDGRLDVAVANTSSNDVHLLLR